MTRLWLICFSLAAATQAATVTGTVSIAGQSSKVRRQHLAGVAVWLEPHDPAVSARPRTVQMLQRRKEFRPHVLAVPTGSTVDFPNADPIFHNAFSNGNGQIFDVGLYPPGTSKKVSFTKAGIVRVFCNIHQSMSAVIVVENTPYLAVTNDRGGFTIAGVTPGEYTLKVFYERATPRILNALSRTIRVGEDEVTLPRVEISEVGYIPLPHKNKYGRDYPPDDSGNPAYSGGSK